MKDEIIPYALEYYLNAHPNDMDDLGDIEEEDDDYSD